MTPITSSITELHSLDQDDQNEVQHDHLGNVIPLALILASSDDGCVINGIITFHQSR